MPVDLYIDPVDQVVVRTVVPPLNLSELPADSTAHFQHPHFRRGMSVLWDFRELEVGGYTPRMIEALSLRLDKFTQERGEGGLAVLVHGGVAVDLANIFRRLNEKHGFPIRVFEDYASAYDWCVEHSRISDEVTTPFDAD